MSKDFAFRSAVLDARLVGRLPEAWFHVYLFIYIYTYLHISCICSYMHIIDLLCHLKLVFVNPTLFPAFRPTHRLRLPRYHAADDALKGVGELPQLARLRAYRRTAERRRARFVEPGRGLVI